MIVKSTGFVRFAVRILLAVVSNFCFIYIIGIFILSLAIYGFSSIQLTLLNSVNSSVIV